MNEKRRQQHLRHTRIIIDVKAANLIDLAKKKMRERIIAAETEYNETLARIRINQREEHEKINEMEKRNESFTD